MELEYDQKFEEMKKYIPFLENMIKRLESTSSSSANPRQAQLDKIRSLRDLLLNKKKRMKMENLLKCEQVLVNLYTKVEQRDTLSGTKKVPDPGFSIDPPTPQEKSDLEAVRNKLKTVAKRQEEVEETLPEILRVNEVEEVHTAGSKEPALFQRRPNKASLSPTRHSPTKMIEDKGSTPSSATKRNYTRVLVSPEGARHWGKSETAEEKPLFSRRSPRRSPKRYSPSYHKRERKKSSKELPSRKSKDLNITLNVPEDSLSTLNTKDIFTRIINCSDGDVDIDTLRELRKQILTELQKTGARDDISDLILKSYNRKKKRTRREEVEEGELSDSESEVIENIYGNICGNLVLKDKNETKNTPGKDKARKIQICLVINSDKDNPDSITNKNVKLAETADVPELEMYSKESDVNNKTNPNKEKIKSDTSEINMQDKDDIISKKYTEEKVDCTNQIACENDVTNAGQQPSEENKIASTPQESPQFKANFYNQLSDNCEIDKCSTLEDSQEVSQSQKGTDSPTEVTVLNPSTPSKNKSNIETELENMENPTEIPLLNEPTFPKTPTNSTVSEIDILQALKNEILSETITLPGSEVCTPLLHQPKIIKVASVKEIFPKKRISIEKYKEKTVNPPKLFLDDQISPIDDHIKKPSLKLTEKECERFNIPKISFDDDSSDGDDGEINASDIYADLAPKSPEHEESSSIESILPILIPVDPVKTVPVNHKVDIDMRTLSIISPNKNNASKLFCNIAVPTSNEVLVDENNYDQSKSQNRHPFMDPRVRRELNSKNSNQSPSSHITNSDKQSQVFPNITNSPATISVTTAHARTYEMTPSRQSFDIEQSMKDHIYVPTFSQFDSRDRENSVTKDDRKSRFDDLGDISWSSSDVSQNTRYSDSFSEYNKGQRNDRYSLDTRDSYLHKRLECPRTPVSSFGRSDASVTSTSTLGRVDKPVTPLHPFGRLECPATPSNSFGRSECPPTPSQSFGRSDCHPAPNIFGSHSFNINECPLTPSQTFGTAECPQTPTPLFGRIDCPLTPNHPFGLLECPTTPIHHFGRSDTTTNQFGRSDFNTQNKSKDPRLNRKSEYESSSTFDERDRVYYKDRGYYRGNSYKSQKHFSGSSDTYKHQDREQSRNSKYRYYAQESGRKFTKEKQQREQNVGVLISKDYETDKLYPKEVGQYNSEAKGYDEVESKRGNQLGKSVGGNMRSEENFAFSSSRTNSARNSSIESDNTLSVKPHAGRSFTIDTSVDATFQNFLDRRERVQVSKRYESNFDARRQRAASVGRILVRESSIGRVFPESSKRTENRKDRFRRASSVGRDLADPTIDNRSFQEVKADFESYRLPVKEIGRFDTGKIKKIDTTSKNTIDRIVRSRKESCEKLKEGKYAPGSSKPAYSPRKNYRDPRMRREYDTKNKYYVKYDVDPRVRKSGIVYSNDNIVTGAILASGYGVKNYKIPKIKRVIEEKEIQPVKKIDPINKKYEKENDKRKTTEKGKEEVILKEKAHDKDKIIETPKQKIRDISKDRLIETPKDKKDTPEGKMKIEVKEKDIKSDTETGTESDQTRIDNMSKSDDQFERRLTRSTRKMLEDSKTGTDVVIKLKKPKRLIINDSDSDTEKSIIEKDDKPDLELKTSELTSPVKEKKVGKNPSAVDIDTNFGLEELEMFSDNVVSDPCLENINALIADLDNDLNTSKNESSNKFTKEISLENMMQNISSPQKDSSNQGEEEFSKVLQAADDLSEVSKHEMRNETNKHVALGDTEVSPESKNTNNGSSTQKSNASQHFDELLKKDNDAARQDVSLSSESTFLLRTLINYDIVSTSETEKVIPVEDKPKIDEENMDGCSTPDSTINTDDVSEKPKNDGEADSTNEVHSEANVTSTESDEAKLSNSSLRTETAPASELGSLLTILQDKSKIKELLSLLGDKSGDNDKIKKKLAKFSEIVSDDETDEQEEQLQKSETSVHTDDNIADVKNIVDLKADLVQEKDKQLNKHCGDHEKYVIRDDLIGEENSKKEEIALQLIEANYKKKMPPKKTKLSRKARGRFAKKSTSIPEKRVTRAAAAVETKPKLKKLPRELLQLREDLKEMFIKEDILSATGIRMCRLAKLVDEKIPTKAEVPVPDAEPVVVLEKCRNTVDKTVPISEKVRKKPGPKPKAKISCEILPEIEKENKPFKYKPGPKSKTKSKRESDPYVFETDSVGDTNIEKVSEDDSYNSCDSELCSLASSKSYGSTEYLADKKKTKRKRRGGWQDGVIKPKYKKKKVESKPESNPEFVDGKLPTEKIISVADMNCFTDRNYCFRKNELKYSCRLCLFVGLDIVHHYKNEHPHVEIPLSRMAPQVAKEAIDQCKEINFEAVSNISLGKYVCIFCFKEFVKNNSVLETFFWHVVSMHTGEYKHNCSECVNDNPCPFSLDIPPPPKDTKGQLIGYICKKCNFTQLSLENLKTHVIVRHNDEQTAVHTINLAAMSKKTLKDFLRKCEPPELPVVQVNSLPQEIIDKRPSTEHSYTTESYSSVCDSVGTQRNSAKKTSLITSIQSKITFEADDSVSEVSDLTSEGPVESIIKIEQVDSENRDEISHDEPQSTDVSEIDRPTDLQPEQSSRRPCLEDQTSSLTKRTEELATGASNDIVDYPHFKINITKSGAKEYICCINGKDNHFKTTLLISMKKHVQLKHSENWEGYCFLCKVIVTPQGAHRFKDCFQHYLDKHMDNFPILQNQVTLESTPKVVPDEHIAPIENPDPSIKFINVRPLADLISSTVELSVKKSPSFPIIQSVMSLGDPPVESLKPSPTYPTVRQDKKPSEVAFKYEEVQAAVMLKKHRVVLETMMAPDRLVKVYKCAGRFCSFTSDSAEDALLHASTHQRIGGVDALNCSYCDFDAMGNAIDLVMHVFKAHGHCQYSCKQCFYRAAASQSVGAHMSRVHGAPQSGATVLRTTTVTANAPVEADILTREQAVPYYVCNHAERDDTCKFRTYTPDKFCEHLQQRHNAAASHPCYICHAEAPTATELVQHMKSHGLKLYQCTWCILGADNEAELLAHVSTVHPTKQPQAYLRIITNKEGSNELRVLPLAFLNKLKVPTEDVTPSTTKENPVREAERSIDLEKLIGLTMIVEPIDEPIDESFETAPENTQLLEDSMTEPCNQSVAVIVDTKKPFEIAEVAPVSRPDVTVISTQVEIENVESQPQIDPAVANTTVEPLQNVTQTFSVKIEPSKTTNVSFSDVVVLDSDEEEQAHQSVIDLSDEDLTTGTRKKIPFSKQVPAEILGTCPKCMQVCKSINGLKKHLYYCYPNTEDPSQCPHCPYQATSRDNILQHYINDHCDKNTYKCGVCRATLMTLALVKRHLRYVHKEKDSTVSIVLENGNYCYTVSPPLKEKKELPKMKASSTNMETAAKRRFGPQEIDRLPINPILDHLVYCDICEFSTKVRLNMVRHLQLHAEQQPVPQTAPVNPVPHLETNEKHFDKMVNLASSSVVHRAPEKPRNANTTFVPVQMPAELAARYPKQISTQQRNTCGAEGCSYISVDAATLKLHWEALHQGKNAIFRCVHCPRNQSVDTKKPLTPSRVVSHLKMHDETLYACSKCNFYHFKRDFLERHLTEEHQNGKLMIVREGASAAAAAAAASTATPTAAVPPSLNSSAAPTMDLIPWQCGFCNFKSMLRPEVADHCFKFHQSKMQYRCAYCPYRASAVENVNNHLAHSHANQPNDVIYYYYREGSLPDEKDGTPRWMIQRQKMGSAVPEVKTEDPVSPVPTPASSPVGIDLNLVKQEVVDEASQGALESIESLCKRYGEFCEPNGIKFKCPLCNVFIGDTREAIQSHLYEELKYRKWSCGLCSYKAFHQSGLTEHMTSEHRRQYDHIELPTDKNIEKWVAGQLDHQASIIDKHKTNLAKQKIPIERNKSGPSNVTPPSIEAVIKYSATQLEESFGAFGVPSDMMYSCPKCGTLYKDEASMRDHLEMELNKIRWGCTNCSEKYQTYHEAQFHCKGHDGPSRPKEAIRDPSMRAAWVSNIIQTQKNAMQYVAVAQTNSEPPTPEKNVLENDNSLLVVRYEERVPTPGQSLLRRKRPAQDSDDDSLVIDVPVPRKQNLKDCFYCSFKTKSHSVLREHVLKHFNLKAYTCSYCSFSSYRQGVVNHTERCHPHQPPRLKLTELPSVVKPLLQETTDLPLEVKVMPQKKLLENETSKVICLVCEKAMTDREAETHFHENITSDFAKKGDVVIKCCICLVLRIDVKSLQEHHNVAHPDIPINYSLFRLHQDTRETHYCGYCKNMGFKYLRDLKSHHIALHSTFTLKYTTMPHCKYVENRKQSMIKSCARKSTTKLPGYNSVAKKSTTKLPYSVPSSSDDGYSYYKTNPEPLEACANVTTLMSFCNRMMPFTLKKLSEIINIEPKVVVNDIKFENSSDKTL